MKRIEPKKRLPARKGRIRELDKKNWTVTFEGEEPIVIPKISSPEYTQKGVWIIGLNAEEDEIFSIHPATALTGAKFLNFISQKDQPPTPKQNPGGTSQAGKKYDPWLSMTALLELTDKEYKGMRVPCGLSYAFAEDEDGNAIINRGGQRGEQLEAFINCVIGDAPIKFSDNILPALQKKALRLNRQFKVMIKGGYVESFIDETELTETDDDTDEDDEVEEKAPASKAEKPKVTEGKAKTKPADPDDDDEDDDDYSDITEEDDDD